MPKPRDRRPRQPPPGPPEPRDKRPSPRNRAYVIGEIRRRLKLLDLHEHGSAQQKAPDLSTGGTAWSDECND